MAASLHRKPSAHRGFKGLPTNRWQTIENAAAKIAGQIPATLRARHISGRPTSLFGLAVYFAAFALVAIHSAAQQLAQPASTAKARLSSLIATRQAAATIAGRIAATLRARLFAISCLAWIALVAACPSAWAQAGEWALMSGSSSDNQPGVYGMLGVPAVGDIPGSRQSPVSWTDSNGHLWLFGGVSFDADGNESNLNDLWEFNPSTNEWAWMGGSSTGSQPGVYGTLGVPAPGNIPGSRFAAVSWTDSSGHFWMFGGVGFDANGTGGDLNDLWQFSPSTNEWAWMGGSSTAVNQPGVSGTLGVPAPGNIPGGRIYPVSWTDSSGNLWLFGGASDISGNFDDLWEFNPSTNEWAWMGGSTVSCNGCSPSGVYGTLGTPAPGNIPGRRYGAVSWTDTRGHLWLFGGYGDGANSTGGHLNDLWQFNPSTNEWAWMGGSGIATCNQEGWCGSSGVYGTLGEPAAGNNPGSRLVAVSWTDSSGNLWLFGGGGFDANGTPGSLNDLWQFNPSTNEWAWMGGSSTVPNCGNFGWCGQPGVYGTLGTPAPGNIPGGRGQAVGWTDSSGHLWLFGGGVELETENDLWEYWPTGATTTPVMTWPAPAAITYGTALSAAQLDATTIVAGTFEYSPAAGTVLGTGTQTLSVTFDPTDTTDYSTARASVALTVNPATPVITWPTPSAITYGTALSATQLDAGTTVPGSFIYTPAAGAVLNAGTQTLNVTFKPNDATDYTTAKASVALVVNPAITFAPLTSPVVYGVPPIHLEATSASGREVHFRVKSGRGFVHHHSWLTITGAGTVVVAAYLEGGPEVTQSIVVNKATPEMKLESWPHSIAQGQWITFKARLRGDCDRPNEVDFDRRTDAGCDRPTGKVTFFDGETRLGESWVHRDGEAVFTTDTLSAGRNSITAVYGGDENYIGVSSTPLDITVQ